MDYNRLITPGEIEEASAFIAEMGDYSDLESDSAGDPDEYREEDFYAFVTESEQNNETEIQERTPSKKWSEMAETQSLMARFAIVDTISFNLDDNVNDEEEEMGDVFEDDFTREEISVPTEPEISNILIPPESKFVSSSVKNANLLMESVFRLGYNSISREFSLKNINSESLDQMRQLLGLLAIETFLRKAKLSHLLALRRQDVTIDIKQRRSDGTIKVTHPTPDYVIGTQVVNGVMVPGEWLGNGVDFESGYESGTILEFKVTTRRYYDEDGELAKVLAKYTDFGKSKSSQDLIRENQSGRVKLIVLKLFTGPGSSWDVVGGVAATGIMKTLVNYISNASVDARNARPMAAEFDEEETDFRENDHIKEMLRERGADYNIGDVDLSSFRDTKKIAEGVVGCAIRMEDYVNEHFLETNEMGEKCLREWRYNPTVFKEHPFNRDKNREKLETLRGEFSPNFEVVGRKANTLLYYPAMFKIQEPSPIEMGMLEANSFDEYEKEAWGMVLKLSVLTHETLPEQIALKELNTLEAFMKTQAESSNLAEYAKEFNVKPDEGSVLRDINTRIKGQLGKIIEKLQSDDFKGMVEGVKISDRGNIVFGLQNKVLKKAGVNQKKQRKKEIKEMLESGRDLTLQELLDAKKENRSLLELADYFEGENGISTQVNSIDVFNSGFEIESITDVYPQKFIHDVIVNDLAALTRQVYDTIERSNGAKIALNLFKVCRTLQMGAPRTDTKRMHNDEVLLIVDPSTGARMMVSKSPDERNSGMVVFFGKILTNEYNQIKDFGWIGPLYWKTVGEYTYFIGKPVRFNWKMINKTEEVFWGGIMTCVGNELLGQKLANDPLYWSLFWNFSRQNTFALEMMYLFHKTAVMLGTFGKNALIDKFKGFDLRNPTAATILYRMFKGQRSFATECFSMSAGSKSAQLVGVKHPVFRDVILNGWEGFLALVYLKQIYPNDDGADEKFINGANFQLNIEMESYWTKSPFHDSRYKWYENNMSMDEFQRLLMPTKNSVIKSAYHGGVIYAYAWDTITKMKDSSQPLRRDIFEEVWKSNIIEDIGPRKCLFPSVVSDVVGNLRPKSESHVEGRGSKGDRARGFKTAKHNNRQERIPSIQSKRVDQANMEMSAFYKMLEADDTLKGLFDKKRIIEQLAKAANGLQSGFTMEEAVLLDISIHPTVMIVTFQLKDQKGWGKRSFFVQMIMQRNANRVWDFVGRPVLLHSNTKHDLIMVKGLKRLTKLQKDTTDVGARGVGMSLTSDKTKYGDTMPVEVLQAQLKAWLDGNYLTRYEYDLLIAVSATMKNRVMLMPASISGNFTKVQQALHAQNGVVDEKIVLMPGSKYALVFNGEEGQYLMDALNDLRANRWMGQRDMFSGLNAYPKFCRQSGWTLGVMNITSSCCSVNIADLKMDVIDLILVGGWQRYCRCFTHSDDSCDATVFPIPAPDYFKTNILKWIEEDLYTGGKLNGLCYRLNGAVLDVVDKNTWETVPGGEAKRPADLISKFYLSMEFFVPRLFGQWSSPLKTGMGYAAEIMQTIITNRGMVYVPITRYLATVFNGGGGKSPTTDAQAGAGAIYNLAVLRAPAVVIHSMFEILNSAIKARYSLPKMGRKEPIQMGGLYYATVDQLLIGGFEANNVRSLMWGQEDKVLKRAMSFWQFCAEVWSEPGEIAGPDNDTSIAEAALDSKMRSASEDTDDPAKDVLNAYRDFLLRYTRNRKSATDAEYFAGMFRESLLEGEPSKYKEMTNKELVAKLKETYSLWTLLPGGNNKISLMKLVIKFYSPSHQENSYRVSGGTASIARKGYPNRLIKWPFSKDVTNHFRNKGMSIPDKVTIKEVYSLVWRLAESDFPMPVPVAEGMNAMYDVAQATINAAAGSAILIKLPKEIHYTDEDYRFQNIQVNKNVKFFNADQYKYALVYWHDMTLYWAQSKGADEKSSKWTLDNIQEGFIAKLHKNMYIFKLIKGLENLEEFKIMLRETRTILLRFSLKSAIQMRMNFRVMVKYYTSRGFHGTALLSARIDDGFSAGLTHLMKNYTYDTVMTADYSYGMREEVKPSRLVQANYTVLDIRRIVSMGLVELQWSKESGEKIVNPRIQPSISLEPINVLKVLRNSLKRDVFKADADFASGIFSCLLWEHVVEKRALKVSRCRKFGPDGYETFILQFSNACPIAISRSSEDIKTGQKLRERKEELDGKVKWLIMGDSRELISFGGNLTKEQILLSDDKVSHTVNLAFALSFIVGNKRSGMRRVSDIADHLVVDIEDDAMFTVVDMMKGITSKDNNYYSGYKAGIQRKAIILYRGDLIDGLGSLNRWDEKFAETLEVGGTWVRFEQGLPLENEWGEDKGFGKSLRYITPWNIGNIPSNWAILKQAFDGSDLLFVDDTLKSSSSVDIGTKWFSQTGDVVFDIQRELVQLATDIFCPAFVTFVGSVGEMRIDNMRRAELQGGIDWETIEKFVNTSSYKHIRDPIGGSTLVATSAKEALKYIRRKGNELTLRSRYPYQDLESQTMLSNIFSMIIMCRSIDIGNASGDEQVKNFTWVIKFVLLKPSFTGQRFISETGTDTLYLSGLGCLSQEANSRINAIYENDPGCLEIEQNGINTSIYCLNLQLVRNIEKIMIDDVNRLKQLGKNNILQGDLGFRVTPLVSIKHTEEERLMNMYRGRFGYLRFHEYLGKNEVFFRDLSNIPKVRTRLLPLNKLKMVSTLVTASLSCDYNSSRAFNIIRLSISIVRSCLKDNEKLRPFEPVGFDITCVRIYLAVIRRMNLTSADIKRVEYILTSGQLYQ